MTSKPPSEIHTLIDAHVKGFNAQDNDLLFSVFGDTAIIIDGIAPYRWLNPNAPANWLADVAKWREDFGVTYEHLSYEMGFWNVEGSSAYAVISGTLTITVKGQSIVRTGKPPSNADNLLTCCTTWSSTSSRHSAEVLPPVRQPVGLDPSALNL